MVVSDSVARLPRLKAHAESSEPPKYTFHFPFCFFDVTLHQLYDPYISQSRSRPHGFL